jgi:hypothetical protein
MSFPPDVSVRASRRGFFAAVAGVAGATVAPPARAAVDPALQDIRRYVYVPVAKSDQIVVVDSDTNRITDTLLAGVVPSRVVVSRDTATLVAADSQAARLSLVNVFSGERKLVDLPAAAAGLTIGASGRIAAAFDPDSGTIVLVDLDEGQVKLTIAGPAHLHDVMFDAEDSRLFVGADGLAGMGVIDVNSARLTRKIAISDSAFGAALAFARTIRGRGVLVRPSDGGPVSIVDPEQGKAIGALASTNGAEGMFPSGTGSYLVIPDPGKDVLRVFNPGKLANKPVELPTPAAITNVYFTWLDSVAFASSEGRTSLSVYDLDHMRQADEVALPGPPLLGVVTADSRTLYLPISDPPVLLAISGEKRQIVGQISLNDAPRAALVAGGWGICH